eukprot:comp22009_c0_seq1/m.31865 comp22009_c0_seq1/g.31865  ORF comp22009_c0_seq1/g.31865 comp22009_c0_seq1/m.31865 type:complete len:208 (-) comp22009_c0_seq1:672-1295(-)
MAAPAAGEDGALPEMKLLIVGPGGVGKSAITVQFIQSKFIEEYDPTIEDSYRKQVTVDEKPVAINILDTAGQEEYSLLREQFMRTGNGFLCIFSITDAESLQSIETIHNQILRVKDKSWFPCVLIGNKADLEHDREVSTRDAQAVAERWKVPYLETSAKTRLNIDEVFFECVRLVRKAEENAGKKNATPGKANVEKKPKKKSACTIL